MGAFFSSLPKPVIAILIIAFGFVVIVLNDPPKTVCDAQIELFKQQQQEFLYARTGAGGAAQPALIRELVALCQSGNSPGGCFEFFVRLKKMNQDLDGIPGQCADAAAGDETLKSWTLGSLRLMSQIAWGDRGPTSYVRRNGWFDTSDISVFCDLRRHANRFYGFESMKAWEASVVSQLPEAEKLEGETAFQNSLFGVTCSGYR